MNNITKIILFLSILLSTTIFTQEIEKFSYDLYFKVKRIWIPPTQYSSGYWVQQSGKIIFTITRVGIIFSGDNAQFTNCGPQDKVYKHEYRKRIDVPGCPFSNEIKSITGVQDAIISWTYPNEPGRVTFDFTTKGVPDFVEWINWSGFGLYQVRILNTNETNESEYVFYLDFLNSKFGAFGGPSADIEISYDFAKPINNRVFIQADAKIFQANNGVVYRNWDELAPNPVNRHGNLYIRGNIPTSELNTDILLSPAIVDANTTILPYTDPTTGITVDTENLHSKIIIDPAYYPEPSKLKDLKLTIADHVTLTAQQNSALIVGAGAEIALGNNSMININPHGNLFINAYSNWSGVTSC